MTFPADLAKLYVEQAGQRYEPSNGTEGEIFMSEWCRHFARDRAMRDGVELEECDDDEVCPIIAASFAGEAKEWIYGEDGQPKCTEFTPAEQPVPSPRCEHTLDMFGG